ncbi:hypothetical protein [Leucobacter tenebrionis]|uniref:hypothetical protein n=1 Tax=Leucobacter tenebrionis TaxID=2873270 RepID=UPI001CA77AE4|nr:hypothetical protein [Leucobacter tenebrionis]QZY52269.1 hypothetical protein KVY00_02010 [Leucobacter tenebrionis]
MESSPNLMLLRRRANERKQLIVKSPQRDPEAADYGLYALVVPDFQGRGSDPRGEKAAAVAFDSGAGMTLEEIAEELGMG